MHKPVPGKYAQKKRRNIISLVIVLIILGFFSLTIFLPLIMLPTIPENVGIAIHSQLNADYSADSIFMEVAGVGANLIEAALADQGVTDIPDRISTLENWLKTPIASITSTLDTTVVDKSRITPSLTYIPSTEVNVFSTSTPQQTPTPTLTNSQTPVSIRTFTPTVSVTSSPTSTRTAKPSQTPTARPVTEVPLPTETKPSLPMPTETKAPLSTVPPPPPPVDTPNPYPGPTPIPYP